MAVYLNSLLLETTLPNKSKTWAQLSAQLAFESNLCMAVPGREAALCHQVFLYDTPHLSQGLEKS